MRGRCAKFISFIHVGAGSELLQPAVPTPPSQISAPGDEPPATQAIPSTPMSQTGAWELFPAIGEAAEASQAAPFTPALQIVPSSQVESAVAEASQAAPSTPALQIAPSSQVESASQMASPERLTQGGSSVPVFQDETWGFSFQELTCQAGDPNMQDPIPAILHRVQNATTWSNFRREVHPPDLFV